MCLRNLQTSLLKNTSLTSLDIDAPRLLREAGCESDEESLKVKTVRLTDVSCQYLVKLIQSSRLESLSARNHLLSGSTTDSLSALFPDSSLRHLDLSYQKVSESQVKLVLQKTSCPVEKLPVQ